MLNIAITAGGTSENMDGVRKITNVSTGSLGWHCLEAVFEYMQRQKKTDFHLYYIITETAIRKELSEEQNTFATFIPVTDAESVYLAVDKLTQETSIDFFIHSMAVSDFTFAYAASVKKMAEEICSFRTNDGKTEAKVMEVLENPWCKYNVNEKISSDENLVIGLKRTKKVIPLIKQNNASTFLVGFKLLRDVDEDQLIESAAKLTVQNDCDMVFANEVSHVSENDHRGILIQNGKIIARPTGKKVIAETIINNLFK